MQEQDMTIKELIKGFEDDIKFDCHSFSTSYRRSYARKELIRRGDVVISEIEEHLRLNPPTDEPHKLKTAWGWIREELGMIPV